MNDGGLIGILLVVILSAMLFRAWFWFGKGQSTIDTDCFRSYRDCKTQISKQYTTLPQCLNNFSVCESKEKK